LHKSGLEMGSDFIARELGKLGHEVHVVVTRRDAGQTFKSEENGIVVWRLPVFPIPLLRSLFEFFTASLMILFLRPGQIHGQALIPCGLLSGFWGKIMDKPSLMYLYGRDVTHPSYFLREVLGSEAMKLNDRVLAATEHCRGNALKIVERDISVFYSGFDHQPSKTLQKKVKGRLLFVGRLEEVKGLDVLLPALEKCEGDWSLQVLGVGREESKLQEQAKTLGLKERIDWVGARSNAEVLQAMQLAEVLILPSREEPFGVVLVEALSQGCRVVASKVGGVPEIVSSEERGLLVQPEDSNVLREAITKALSLGAVSAEVVEEVQQFYSWENRIKELEAHYGR
jgi:glycosyltransferase involved in cell wall biosynthesis